MDLGNIEVQDIDSIELTAEDLALLEDHSTPEASNASDTALLRELNNYAPHPAGGTSSPAMTGPTVRPAGVPAATAAPSTGSASAYSSAPLAPAAAPAAAPPAPAPAAPAQVVVSPEALALIHTLAAQVNETVKKAQAIKAAGKRGEAEFLVKEVKELQADIEKLKRAGSGPSSIALVEGVKAALTARKGRANREGLYFELRQALISYYKSRTADLNTLIAKLRLPGLPNPKRHELSQQANALRLEKTKLENQIELLELYYRHASYPPVSSPPRNSRRQPQRKGVTSLSEKRSACCKMMLIFSCPFPLSPHFPRSARCGVGTR